MPRYWLVQLDGGLSAQSLDFLASAPVVGEIRRASWFNSDILSNAISKLFKNRFKKEGDSDRPVRCVKQHRPSDGKWVREEVREGDFVFNPIGGDRGRVARSTPRAWGVVSAAMRGTGSLLLSA